MDASNNGATHMTIAIVRHSRKGANPVQNMIDASYAMDLVLKHFNASPANYVAVEGKLCFTFYQAEKAITSHFKEVAA